MCDKAKQIIIDLLVAIDIITYQHDIDSERNNSFRSNVDLNEYIGDEINAANIYINGKAQPNVQDGTANERSNIVEAFKELRDAVGDNYKSPSA